MSVGFLIDDFVVLSSFVSHYCSIGIIVVVLLDVVEVAVVVLLSASFHITMMLRGVTSCDCL
jgi:hypothetical protein